MGQDSKIEWTTHTFNPWIGCAKVSAGCQFCYAEEMMDKRYKRAQWGVNGTRVVTSDSYWKQPLKWNRDAEKEGVRKRVFCASLADVFEDRPELHAPRTRLFDLIRQTPHLDWLLLTKRPENIFDCLLNAYYKANVPQTKELACWLLDWHNDGSPPANVWLGTSVESQEAADKRIPGLLKVPAAVRFLSCEPLLGPVDIRYALNPMPCDHKRLTCEEIGCCGTEKVHWVIAGGESGPNARPMHPGWARSLRDQCVGAGVAFHFKQWGENLGGTIVEDSAFSGGGFLDCRMNGYAQVMNLSSPRIDKESSTIRVGKKVAGRLLDGRTWDELPKDEAQTGAVKG